MRRARNSWKAIGLALTACIVLGALVASIANGASSNDRISFKMIRSAGLEGTGCLPNAGAEVTDQSNGPVERLTVNVHGLPANTDFDFFVIQVPNCPFGLAWYQGDIETGPDGTGHGVFVGRFSIETFIVAPGTHRLPWFTTSRRSRTQARIRQPHRFTRSTWDCGSTPQPTPSRPAVPGR